MINRDEDIRVSVVLPVYNEEKFIDNCISSLLKQDYPKDNMEWILVDGNSTDKSKEIAKSYMEKYPRLIKIYDNPNRTVPFAMNIGIRATVGKYIIRLDAHAEYAVDYISRCVYYLETTDADNVGGMLETKSKGFVGNAIASMLSSAFGVGNSKFRTNGKSGYVDTVPFGAFRRKIFEEYGGFDERFICNEDNEINYRIRKNGGKVYLAEDIRLTYYCRNNIRDIIDMAVRNGRWNAITLKLCPGAIGARHLIPFVAFTLLAALPALTIFSTLFIWALIVLICLYILLDLIFSAKSAVKIRYMPLLLVLFPAFHLSYGLGSWMGLAKRNN